MENEFLPLLKQMNEKMDKQFEQINEKMDKQFEQMKSRLDQHERMLQTLITMTAKNTEDIHALRTENNQRFDKVELAFYKVNSDIDLLFKETQTNKRDIAYLKS